MRRLPGRREREARNPYVSAGGAYEHDLLAEADRTETQRVGDAEWQFVSEIGVKLRARISGKWRILSLGYHFAGIRFGYRNAGFDDVDSGRIIIEIGAGIG